MTWYTKAAVLSIFSRDFGRFQRPLSGLLQDQSYFHANYKTSFTLFHSPFSQEYAVEISKGYVTGVKSLL